MLETSIEFWLRKLRKFPSEDFISSEQNPEKK